MSGLNYCKLGSTLSNICNTTQLDNLTTPLNATTPSKISGENPGLTQFFMSFDAEMVDMLVGISGIDDLNKLSRLFSYVLGYIGTLICT